MPGEVKVGYMGLRNSEVLLRIRDVSQQAMSKIFALTLKLLIHLTPHFAVPQPAAVIALSPTLAALHLNRWIINVRRFSSSGPPSLSARRL